MAAAAAFVVVACSTPTQLTHVQVAPEAQRTKVRNVLVVGLFKDPSARKAYEYDMVKTLKEAGVQAQASQDLMPIGQAPTRPDVERLVKERGFDGAVVGHLVDAHTDVQAYGPVAVDPGFYGWYGAAYPMAYQPTLETTTTVVVQTRVFATSTGQPEFSASSQSIDPHSAAEVAQEHAELVVNALKHEGVV
jgi:hypothetical protein